MVVETRKRKASGSLSKPDAASSSKSPPVVVAPPKKLKLSTRRTKSVANTSSSTSRLANKTPVPLSIMGGTFTTPDWLPDGLTMVVLAKATGQKFKVYKETATGKKFYSKPQVLNYFGIPHGSNSNKRKVEVAPPQKKQVSTISTKPFEIPKRLYNLIQKTARVRKSLKLNSNNRSAKRELESLESEIHRHRNLLHGPCSQASYITQTQNGEEEEEDEQGDPITWSSPNYHGSYPLNNDELEVWNLFRSTEKAVAQRHMVVGVGKDLDMVDKDDRVIYLLGKFAVDTFNRSCQMYLNEDEDNQVSGAEFMECKFYKFASQYIFYMTVEAIELGIPGVYETRVECDSDGAKTLMNFKLTDRKPKLNRPWVKPCLEPEVEYETVQDGSSDPQDYYELTGLVHRETEGGGFNYHNPLFSPHRLVYTSIKDEKASDFEDFAPNVTQPLNSVATKTIPMDL